MNRTPIEWTDFTSNPLQYRNAAGKVVWACIHKSTGCLHCYAEKLALRWHRGELFNVKNMEPLTPFIDEKELRHMLTYKPASGKRCFVGDMTDIFGEWVPFELPDRLFAVFALRPDVVFQVLTKRPERMLSYVSDRFRQDAIVGEIRRIGNRPKWPHLETEDALREGNATQAPRYQDGSRRTTARRIHNKGGVFGDPGKDRRQEIGGRGPSDSLDLLQRTNPGPPYNQSQERNQGRQSSRELGVSNLQSAKTPRDNSSGRSAPRREGLEASENTSTGIGCGGDAQVACDWNDGKRHSAALRNDQESNIGNLRPPHMEAHLVWPLPSVHLGVSVENRDALHRIDTLRSVPAAVRFVSFEPLLEDLGALNLEGIHWAIIGGESGPKARPMHPDWARSIRDQCQAAGVAFFFKQWGEWAPRAVFGERPLSRTRGEMVRVGKKAAGAMLDGREWKEWPENPRVSK